MGKIIEVWTTVGDHYPPVGKIVTCTLKNHNLLFLIKHFECLLGIIKIFGCEYLKIYYGAKI